MTRKLRPLLLEDLGRLPTGCGGCAFWESAGERERRCGGVCDSEFQRAWHRRVTDEWGECGRVAYEDDELLGFVKYAPSGYFPQVRDVCGGARGPCGAAHRVPARLGGCPAPRAGHGAAARVLCAIWSAEASAASRRSRSPIRMPQSTTCRCSACRSCCATASRSPSPTRSTRSCGST